MIELPVYNRQGQQIDTIKVDRALFGSIIRRRLLKQALVMYLANRRQGTATTKSRGMVDGSTRKLFRQKGTGRARMGTIRTNVRRGGGVAFAKVPKDWSQKLPAKAKKLARDSALLSKMEDGEFLIIDELSIEKPKTKDMINLLATLKIDNSCLIGVEEYDKNVYLSTRNIQKVDVIPVSDFNAYDVLRHRNLLLTRSGFDRLLTLASGAGNKDKVKA